MDVHKSRSQKQLWDNDLSIVKVDTKSKGDTAVKEVESDTDSDTSDSERTDVEKEESVPKNQTTPATSGKVFCFIYIFFLKIIFGGHESFLFTFLHSMCVCVTM